MSRHYSDCDKLRNTYQIAQHECRSRNELVVGYRRKGPVRSQTGGQNGPGILSLRSVDGQRILWLPSRPIHLQGFPFYEVCYSAVEKTD